MRVRQFLLPLRSIGLTQCHLGNTSKLGPYPHMAFLEGSFGASGHTSPPLGTSHQGPGEAHRTCRKEFLGPSPS